MGAVWPNWSVGCWLINIWSVPENQFINLNGIKLDIGSRDRAGFKDLKVYMACGYNVNG